MFNVQPTSINCHSCNKVIPILGQFRVTRTEECPYCSVALHCCKMCKYYDIRVYNECTETMAERVVDKEKSNFCAHFTLFGQKQSGPTKEDLINNADALFKK